MSLLLKEKAKKQELAIGTFVFEFFEVGLPMMAKEAGSEFLILDMEHSGASFERLKPLILISKAIGITPIVRVPDSQYHHIATALDIGAEGIMVPKVESIAQVEDIIYFSKYGPIGERGNAFGIAHDDYRGGDIPAKMKEINERIMIIPLIETELGVRNVEEIAAFDEVDLIWIGHLDLTQSLGIPGDFAHPTFSKAVEHISTSLEKKSKSGGILIQDPQDMKKWLEIGVRFFSYSADLWLFQHALAQGITKMKSEITQIGLK